MNFLFDAEAAKILADAVHSNIDGILESIRDSACNGIYHRKFKDLNDKQIDRLEERGFKVESVSDNKPYHMVRW